MAIERRLQNIAPIRKDGVVASDSFPSSAPEIAPMPIVAILDSAVDFLLKHFLSLFQAAALFYLPVYVVCYALEQLWIRPDLVGFDFISPAQQTDAVLALLGKYMLVGSPTVAIPGLLPICVLLVASGPLCLYILSIWLGEAPTSPWKFVRNGIKRAIRLIPVLLIAFMVFTGTALIVLGIAFFLLGLLSIALRHLLAQDTLMVTITVYSVVSSILSYFVATGVLMRYFLFAGPIIVYEGLPTGAVWERNARLISISQAVRIWIVGALLTPVLLILVSAALSPLNYVFSYFALPALISDPLQAIISFTIAVLLYLYILIVIVRLYLDCRVRREAFDVRIWAQHLFNQKERLV